MSSSLIAASLLLAWIVEAQHVHGTGPDAVVMVPFLHFEGGDALWFRSWRPSSKGAIAGAAIGLFVFAILERWIAGMRGLMEVHWRRQAEQLLLARYPHLRESSSSDGGEKEPSVHLRSRRLNMRALTAFNPRQDILRGMFQVIQSTLGFAFMLAIMTCQGAFFIAIVLGLGVGEALFGRFASLASAAH